MLNPKHQYSYIKNLYKRLVKANPFLEPILIELSKKYRPGTLEGIPPKYEEIMNLILQNIIALEGENTKVRNAQELRRLVISDAKYFGVNSGSRVKKPFINSPVPKNSDFSNPFANTIRTLI